METKAQHTPGPWFFDPTNLGQHVPSQGIYWAIGHSGKDEPGLYVNCKLNQCDSESLTDFDPECEANARLIAAAPELLSTCNRISEWLNRLADAADERAQVSERFPSYADANRADAKNYRATAANVDKAIAKAEGRK